MGGSNSGLKPGYSRHLGGPWYLQRSPDSGRLTYAKDYGPGTIPVPKEAVPKAIREKGGL